jgi:flavin-dependent dehydrogenase
VNINSKLPVDDARRQIVVVGGGPAGTSIAIRLAQKNFQVTLIEREKFPREKLCGEFISPECLPHFRELCVFDEMLSAGGDRISETHFFALSGKSIAVPTQWFDGAGAALSLSRAEMDFRLLQRAREVGVEVIEEANVIGVEKQNDYVKALTIRHKNGEANEIFANLFIDATGRTRILSKLITKNSHDPKTQNQKPTLIGFKAHLRNVHLNRGRCELYSFLGGYGGLSNIENGLANLCFLVRSSVVREFGSDANRIIKELMLKNARASETLRNAEPVHDWIAVAVDRFGICDLNPAKNVLAVGDAAAFIDPFTGSGMLMAFESSELLASCITENGVAGTADAYQAQYHQRFARRLRIGELVRRAAFMPRSAALVISILSSSRTAREYLARATRQSPQINANKR